MKDMAKIPGLYQRGNKWYLRIVVPKDLIDAYEGRTEIRTSLQTSDYTEAKKRANLQRVKMDAEIDDLRKQATIGKTISQPAISNLPNALGISIVQQYVAEQDTSNAKDELLAPELDESDKFDLRHETEIGVSVYSDQENPNTQRDVYRRSKKLLDSHGLKSDFHNDEYNVFSELVWRAMVELSKRSLAREKQDYSKAFFDVLFSPDTVMHTDITFGEICDSYFSEYSKTANVKEKRLKKVQAAIGLLTEFFGTNRPVQSIAREDCRDFRDKLNILPANAKKTHPKKSLTQILEHAEKSGLAPLAYETQNHYLTTLIRCLDWAVKEDYIPKNPALELKPLAAKPTNSTAREKFSTAQLQKIFEAPIYTGCKNDKAGYAKPGPNIIKRGRFWISLIALFSGMRENEICQLMVSDIGLTEEGNYFFDNNTLDESKSLKNESSRRWVPIHPVLISIGLLEYVERMKLKKETHLFPEIPIASTGYRSDSFTKWFNSGFLTKVGVKTKQNGFHSFRHTFTDALVATEAPEEIIKRLAGWADKKSMLQTYGDGHTVDHLMKYLSKVKYDVDLSFLHVN